MCTEENPCRCLLVEDSEDVIKPLLAENQHGKYSDYALDLIVARTTKEAIEIIKSAERPFDIVSIDPGMPDSRGEDTYNLISEAINDPYVPKFIYTGAADTPFIDFVISHGAERVIFKGDWSPSQYLTVLHFAAGQYRARAREKRERRYYKQKSEDLAKELTQIRQSIPDSKASKELDRLISNMRMAVAS
jgi:DNA-binding NarL/FixJ family response regulator